MKNNVFKDYVVSAKPKIASKWLLLIPAGQSQNVQRNKPAESLLDELNRQSVALYSSRFLSGRKLSNGIKD